MRPSEYAINLTAMLFCLAYEKIDCTLSQPITTIYKHRNATVSKNIDIIGDIIFKIIHRKVYKKVPTKTREYSESLYIMNILDPKNSYELLIWLNMHGEIGPYDLLKISFL
jgi:hypothetical protein